MSKRNSREVFWLPLFVRLFSPSFLIRQLLSGVALDLLRPRRGNDHALSQPEFPSGGDSTPSTSSSNLYPPSPSTSSLPSPTPPPPTSPPGLRPRCSIAILLSWNPSWVSLHSKLLLIVLCCAVFSNCSCDESDRVFLIELFKNYPPFQNHSDETPPENPNSRSTIQGLPPSYSPTPDVFSYGGGPDPSYILENPISVYIIWYGNWSYSGSHKDRNVLTNFIDSLSYQLPSTTEYSRETSATVKGWWDIVRTFYNPDNMNHVSGNVTRVDQIFDHFSMGTDLSQPMVEELIESHFVKKTLPVDKDGLYIVFASGEICYRGVSWNPENETPCSVCLGCGFHGAYESTHNSSNRTLSYAYVANSYSSGSVCESACMPKQGRFSHTPNNNTGIDVMVNVLAHELAESATDKGGFGAGWAMTEDRMYEIADYCQIRFSPTFYADGLGSRFNLIGKGGMKFLVQQVFRLGCGCLLQAGDCKTPPPPMQKPPPTSPSRKSPPPGRFSVSSPPPLRGSPSNSRSHKSPPNRHSSPPPSRVPPPNSRRRRPPSHRFSLASSPLKSYPSSPKFKPHLQPNTPTPFEYEPPPPHLS